MSEDLRLTRAFDALAPSEAAVDRVAAALAGSFEAPPPSLFAEWVELLRIRPLVHGAYVLAASGVAVAASAPVSVLLLLLRQGLRGHVS